MATPAATFEQLVANLGKPERRTLNGREFLVAPITIFPPGGGVMAGSKGPLFYSDHVTRANARAWNHFPIVARHPVSANGTHVRADDPVVLDKQRLGFLLNDREEDGKRRVDGWYDVEATRNYDRKNGTAILNDLEAGKLIEVSTGLLTEDREVANGSHNGRGYTHEVINWTPDHLAVLPDQKGACSVADGCGVFNVEPERKGVMQKIMDGLRSLVKLADNSVHEDEDYHCAECEGKPESEHCDKCKEMAANVRSLNTGKFKPKGSGYGKGDMHEACQAGAMMLTARDRELGADAARQLAETGANPASWVADEATWDRAKAAAAKTYDEGDEAYWPAVTHIYKQMGGGVKDAAENAFCPGEGARDNSCSSSGGSGGGKDEPNSEGRYPSKYNPKITYGSKEDRDEDDVAFGKDIERTGKAVGKIRTEIGKVRSEKSSIEEKYRKQFEAIDKYEAEGKAAIRDKLEKKKAAIRDKYARNEVKATESEFDAIVNERLCWGKPCGGGAADKDANNESGNPLDDSIFNEGGSPMTMTEEQRGTVVKELAANCEAWRGEEETLNEMNDEQLIKHAKAHQTAQANAVTANAVRDVLKPPKDLKANEMPAFIKKKIAEKESEEEEEEEEEMMTDSAAADNAAPPRKPTFDDLMAVAPPEWKEAVANAVKITRDQKAGIVRRLVANVREEKARERLAAKYAKLPLGDLQDMLALVPARQQRPTANEGGLESYLGSAGSLAGNVLYSKEDELADNESVDLMTAPTFSIEDARKTA